MELIRLENHFETIAFFTLRNRVRLMVFNATFNNVSAISCRSVLLVRTPEDPEKTTDLSQVTDKLYT